MTDDAVVLIVEDERDLADLYAMWLSEAYDVRTAYDAEQALELMDDAVDVVLLDRRLPGMSGDAFLEEIRGEGLDCPVAVVSAVEPDFDVLAMGFDDYVVKPVEKEGLATVVEEMLALESVATESREYHAGTSKREALEAEKTEEELAGSGEYAEIVGSVEAFRTRVLALAEAVIDAPRHDHGGDERSVYEEAIADWEERKRSMDPEDPLYEIAEEKIAEYRERVETGSGGGEDHAAERELLEIVAENFVAEGFWLDSRLLKALNQLFFGKYGDSFVIEHHPLEEGADLGEGETFRASQAVRERAAEELAALP